MDSVLDALVWVEASIKLKNRYRQWKDEKKRQEKTKNERVRHNKARRDKTRLDNTRLGYTELDYLGRFDGHTSSYLGFGACWSPWFGLGIGLG